MKLILAIAGILWFGPVTYIIGRFGPYVISEIRGEIRSTDVVSSIWNGLMVQFASVFVLGIVAILVWGVVDLVWWIRPMEPDAKDDEPENTP